MALGLSLAVSAAPASELEQARRLVEALQFSQAAPLLEKVRRSPTAPAAERLEALSLLGRSYAALGHAEEAEQAFSELLQADASSELPADVSPKVRMLFDAAKARLYPPGTLTLLHRGSAGRTVSVELSDPWHRVASLTVVEQQPDGRWLPRSLAPAGRSELLAGEGALALYVEATGRDGAKVAALGSQEAPLWVAPAAQPAPPAAVSAAAASSAPRARWPKAVLLGVAAAAALTGGVLLAVAQSQAQAARQSAPGQPGYFAVDALALNDQARTRALWADGLLIFAGVAGAVGLGWWLAF